MSKYTTEVRYICETLAGFNESQGYGKVGEIIRYSWDKIFDFDFPMFDESYRSVLCQKILRHFYTREIGFETVGLWKLKLETKMNEIMPYFNKLYLTETLEFNPLYDVDYTTNHQGEGSSVGVETNEHTGTVNDDGSHTGTVQDAGTHGGTVSNSYNKTGNVDDVGHEENENTRWDIYSDTPQGALTNVENETYLTNARKISDNGEKDNTNDRDYSESGSDQRNYNETMGNVRTFNEGSGNERTYDENNEKNSQVNTTNEYIQRVSGKMGSKSYSNLVQEYRDILLNIDMQVIEQLNKLFMLVW